VEVGERVRVAAEERARVRAEGVSAEVARVLVREAEELVAEVVRVVGLGRAEAERAREERERRENG
jgi:hypothetical protein